MPWTAVSALLGLLSMAKPGAKKNPKVLVLAPFTTKEDAKHLFKVARYIFNSLEPLLFNGVIEPLCNN